MKTFLDENNIEMYSTQNGGKPVIAERFIRTYKTKIFKYMTTISKNKYIDERQNIVKNCNNKEIKNTAPWLYVIEDLHSETIRGTFSEQELQKTQQKEFRIDKSVEKEK